MAKKLKMRKYQIIKKFPKTYPSPITYEDLMGDKKDIPKSKKQIFWKFVEKLKWAIYYFLAKKKK